MLLSSFDLYKREFDVLVDWYESCRCFHRTPTTKSSTNTMTPSTILAIEPDERSECDMSGAWPPVDESPVEPEAESLVNELELDSSSPVPPELELESTTIEPVELELEPLVNGQTSQYTLRPSSYCGYKHRETSQIYTHLINTTSVNRHKLMY